MYFLSLWLFSFLTLILQVTLFDLLFHGRITLEITMILVVYAGFNLDITRGGILAFTIGLFYDSVASIIPGVFVLVYMLVFMIAKVISDKVRGENALFIMVFTFVSVLLEGVIIFLLYTVLLDSDFSSLLFLKVFFPQALIVSFISPILFPLFRRVEVWAHVWESE
jgi:rod shape-determining protein MreD